MKLIHLANYHSTNIGNGALIFGAERVLKEDLGSNLNFYPEPWDDYTFGLKKFDQGFVELVNQKSDGLLVGGAVTFNGRDYLQNTGMRLDLPLELWPKISKPIIFYGVSYRVWPGQEYYHLDKLKKVVGNILSQPRIIFGVRNDGTKKWLESLLGYQSDKIISIPDPAIFVPVQDSRHPELVEGKSNILISLNNEDEAYRFGGKKEQFLKHLAAALEALTKELDVNFILCPHYLDDYKIIGELISLCPPRVAHQLMVSTGLLKVPQTAYFYDLYAKVDLVLSMRVHSMSPAVGLGTPVVPLVSQTRMDEFLKDAGLEDFALSIFDQDLAEKLFKRSRYCLSQKDEVKRRLQSVKLAMRERTSAYNQRIALLLQ